MGCFIIADSVFQINVLLFFIGLSVRSVCWGGEKILAGTNGGEIFEISAADKEKPVTLVQVRILKVIYVIILLAEFGNLLPVDRILI